MTSRAALAALSALCLAVSASAGTAKTAPDVFFCGGETTRAKAQAYFARLKLAVNATSPKSRFNEFVAPEFMITDSRGRTLSFKRADFNSVTPGRITLEEWRESSARGFAAVSDVGWRGCMMSHGKVWFDSSETHGLVLREFHRTMAWDPAERR